MVSTSLPDAVGATALVKAPQEEDCGTRTVTATLEEEWAPRTVTGVPNTLVVLVPVATVTYLVMVRTEGQAGWTVVAPMAVGKALEDVAPIPVGKALEDVAPMPVGKALEDPLVAPMPIGKALEDPLVAPMPVGKTPEEPLFVTETVLDERKVTVEMLTVVVPPMAVLEVPIPEAIGAVASDELTCLLSKAAASPEREGTLGDGR